MCVCTRARLYAFRIVSRDMILRLNNNALLLFFIIIINVIIIIIITETLGARETTGGNDIGKCRNLERLLLYKAFSELQRRWEQERPRERDVGICGNAERL